MFLIVRLALDAVKVDRALKNGDTIALGMN